MNTARRGRRKRRSWNLRIIESENLRGWRMDKDKGLKLSFQKHLEFFIFEDLKETLYITIIYGCFIRWLKKQNGINTY